jgi:hypothetical protein
MDKYGALRTIAGLYKVLGLLVAGLGSVAALFVFGVMSQSSGGFVAIPAALIVLMFGLGFFGAGQLIDAVADTATASQAAADRLEKLLEIQTQAAADLAKLAATVKPR